MLNVQQREEEEVKEMCVQQIRRAKLSCLAVVVLAAAQEALTLEPEEAVEPVAMAHLEPATAKMVVLETLVRPGQPAQTATTRTEVQVQPVRAAVPAAQPGSTSVA